MDLAAPELRHLIDVRFTNSPVMPRRENVVRGSPERVGEEHEEALSKVLTVQPDGEATKPDPRP
jgi:hypothetical protein